MGNDNSPQQPSSTSSTGRLKHPTPPSISIVPPPSTKQESSSMISGISTSDGVFPIVEQPTFTETVNTGPGSEHADSEKSERSRQFELSAATDSPPKISTQADKEV